jgi:hypothetical protein
MSPVEKFTYCAWGLYLLITVPFVWSLFRDANALKRRNAWPGTTGRVVDHRLRTDKLSRCFDEMRVQYDFGGAAYDKWLGPADQRSRQPRTSMAREAILDAMKKLHPSGSPVEVRVNPENHGDAFVFRREFSGTVFASIVASLLAAFFLVFVYIGIQMIR